MVYVRGNTAEFRLHGPDAREVFLVGDFNWWWTEACALTKSRDGFWVACLRLPSGSHRFRYLVDGEAQDDYVAYGPEMGTPGRQEGVIDVGLEAPNSLPLQTA